MISRETLEELWYQKLMEEYARRMGEQYERENAATPEELRELDSQLTVKLTSE